MESTLHALGGIVLKGLPTFFIIVILHFYLKGIFFKPLQKVMSERHEATEGARVLAESSLAAAEAKALEYEAAVRAARNDIYKAHEQTRDRWRQEQAEQLAQARMESETVVKNAKAELAVEVASSRAGLHAESERLADEIAEMVLRRPS